MIAVMLKSRGLPVMCMLAAKCPAKAVRIRAVCAQVGAVTVKTVSRKGILRPFEVDRGQHIRRVKTLPMLRRRLGVLQGAFSTGNRPIAKFARFHS